MGQENLFVGEHIRCEQLDGGIAKLVLDHGKASVNKFDAILIADLRQAVDAIKNSKIKGLILTSAKEVFVVGADITDFLNRFEAPVDELKNWLRDVHRIFADIEDLPFPTVTCINGVCLGGGMELALSSCYRIASKQASVGLPETKLGIYPGWGGTIRLPRLIGADNALEWIASGGTFNPEEALKYGAIDAIVDSKNLEASATSLIMDATAGKLAWKERVAEKKSPLRICTPIEAGLVLEGGKAFVAGQAGPNYPAPVSAADVIAKHAGMAREQAIEVEIDGFVKLAQGPVAKNLVSIFLSDQYVKKKSKGIASEAARKIKQAGVLGAGIMGGGIAYQSASRGVPILMKDIRKEALDLGLKEASKLFAKQVERKKLGVEELAIAMAKIVPVLSYGDFANIDIVVEAVVENEKVKKAVLAEVEGHVGKDAILASNTSTISITSLATALKRPENFCGMHFFNPVHRMPLVEVIRGAKTSPQAIAATVAYAVSLGKTPIVVGDCPGFLVNRVLFPYIFAFLSLIEEGADFVHVDKVMEKFGWPMGPAYLLDVIGIDTCVHAGAVMAAGFPERMTINEPNAISILNSAKRLGQKSGAGFYSYAPDKSGKPKKQFNPDILGILAGVQKSKVDLSDEDIVKRLMAPMINESIRCLEENIAQSAMEADLALLYGIGFPPFRGGALKYVDDQGAATFAEWTAALGKKYGKCYEPPELLLKKAKDKSKFYSL